MTRNQRELVDELFGDLCEREPAEWDAALAAVEDAAVRAEVESLLLHMDPPTKGLSTSIGEMMQVAAESGAFEDRTAGPGTRFERYRIQRKIGQGGMGDVYEAVRENDFHKRVALKIVRYGLDSEFARGRFQQERQTLAGLEHSFIARLLDGGEAENGCPYLVLEFVDGVPIDTYCTGRSREEVLKLFLKVCEAVEYAHRNLVIHRDLKPANILVTEDGDPKLLDFGIAKLLEQGASVTLTMQVALTPQYASPEQVRGGPITTASDVYSLGVILYQLLTGRKPYEVSTTTALELERIVCVEAPAPARLGDELDDILMMVLRKEPERRYASVLLLAQDIERYRNGRPVAATRDSALYRSRKYVRRHWIGLASTAVAVLAMCIGTGVATYQAYIAKQRLAQVRKLANTFLFDFHDQLVNIAGTTKARAFVVKTAQEYLSDLSKNAGSDPELQAELAQAYRRLGDAQGSTRQPSLDDRVGAEASYRHASALYESLALRHPHYIVDAAESWRVLAVFFRDEERADDAKKALDRALLIAEPLRKDGSSRALSELAGLEQTAGDLAEARTDSDANVRYSQSALNSLQQWALLQPKPEMINTDLRLGKAHFRLGRAQREDGEVLAAEQELLAAHAIFERLLSIEPQNSRVRTVAVASSVNLASLYGEDILPGLDRPADAIVYARKAIDQVASLIDAEPSDVRSRVNLLAAQVILAHGLFVQTPGEGLQATRRVLTAWKELSKAKPLPIDLALPFLDELRALVPVLSKVGVRGEADSLAMQILSDRRKLLAGTPPTDETLWYIIVDLGVAADAARGDGNEAEAGRLLQEGLQTSQPFLAAADKSLILATFASSLYDGLERNAVATGRCAEAKTWQEKEGTVWQHLAPSNQYAAMRLQSAGALPLPCAK